MSRVVNMSNFFLNSIFRNKIMLTLIFTLPVISALVPALFLPFGDSGSVYMVDLNIIIPTAFIFGVAIHDYKNSTLRDNEGLIRSNRIQIYITVLLIGFVIIMAMIIMQLLWVWLFIEISFINPSGAFDQSDDIYHISEIYYGMWIYSNVLVFNITFAICFATRRFFKTQKGFLIMWMLILIMCIMWGGMANRYIQRWFRVDQVTGERYDYYWYITNNGKDAIIPWEMWPVSLMFPYYASGEMVRVASFPMGEPELLECLSPWPGRNIHNYGDNNWNEIYTLIFYWSTVWIAGPVLFGIFWKEKRLSK